MKNLIRKLSIKAQATLIFLVVLLFLLIVYVFISKIIENTWFYENHYLFFTVIYFFLGIIISCGISLILLDKLLKPIDDLILYMGEFNDIRFDVVYDDMLNQEECELSKGLKQIQAEVFKNVDELQKINREVTHLMETLNMDFIEKRNLVSSISHDIKTPLTIIYTTISAIRDGLFSEEETKEELENILIEIDKTTSMLQDVITMFKNDAEISNIHKEEFGLVETISKITDNFEKLFQKYNQTLLINIPYDIKINADKKQFERLLDNLLINAIIHSPENNEVKINLVTKGANHFLEIINTGVTIDDDNIKHIFDPFFQGEKSRTKLEDHGNGLGLYIAKEICKKNDLIIDVINLDNAVKFYIIIPKK